jgi:hypothetical protein
MVPYALRAAQLHEKRSRLKRIFNELGTFFDPAVERGDRRSIIRRRSERIRAFLSSLTHNPAPA